MENTKGGHATMADEKRPGFYLDKHGVWQKDRRKSPGHQAERVERGESGQLLRRKTDQQILDREHREMMEEALKDFSSH